jgi:uncharacterized membrane protein
MSPLGTIHLAAALLALASGAVVLLRPKGTGGHRAVGWVYAGAMLATNLTALGIYRLLGRFGPFHAAAIASLVTTVIGVVAIRRRAGPHAVARHYFWMTYSYVGLAAAAVSETATRLARPQSGAAFGLAVFAASALVFAVGARRIRRGAAAQLAPFGAISSGA